MALTKERRNEIAWMLAIKEIERKGIHHFKTNEHQRQFANSAKELGISKEEARDFAKEIIMPLVKSIFADPKK